MEIIGISIQILVGFVILYFTIKHEAEQTRALLRELLGKKDQ